MSGRLTSAVFDSALPAWLKPYAAACASFASDRDGTRVYPSIARIARMVGRCERATQTAIHELERRGVLEVVAPARQHTSTHYRFVYDALPFSDGDQLRLFAPQGFPQARSQNAGQVEDFHRHAQSGVQWASVRGAVDCTRSVIDPSRTSTHLARARKGKYPKTGTDDGR